MKKIAISLGVIGVVAAIVIGATTAYFSDTETSTKNTFTAGTIDISIDGENPWTRSFTLGDMKPGYTDNIIFNIQNTGSGANPVDVWKKIKVISEITGTVSEPECTAESGTWNESDKTCDGTEINNLSSQIIYDLSVEVYNAGQGRIWWQTIYVDGDNKTLGNVYGSDQEVYLGMIPAGGYMKVTQSYHFDPNAGNEYQGDEMTFDIQVRGEQLRGTAVLENKTAGPEYKLIDDAYAGTLTYEVKNPTFDFSFTGKVTQSNTSYTLLHAVDPWPQTNSVVLGTTTSDANGNVDFSGDVELSQHMKDAKVWLILSSDWSGAQMTGWHQADYLLETGLIWYEDTDL